MQDQLTFKRLFCVRFGCPESEYERIALLKMFHKRWLPLALIFYKLNSQTMRTDRRILQQIAITDSLSSFSNEAVRIKDDYRASKDYGILRRSLKFRLSGQRMLRVGAEVWAKKVNGGWGEISASL